MSFKKRGRTLCQTHKSISQIHILLWKLFVFMHRTLKLFNLTYCIYEPTKFSAQSRPTYRSTINHYWNNFRLNESSNQRTLFHCSVFTTTRSALWKKLLKVWQFLGYFIEFSSKWSLYIDKDLLLSILFLTSRLLQAHWWYSSFIIIHSFIRSLYGVLPCKAEPILYCYTNVR